MQEGALVRIGRNKLASRIAMRSPGGSFAPYPKARLVRGQIPETLPSVSIPQFCYLSRSEHRRT